MPKRDRPSLFYRLVVLTAKPVMYGLYRLQVDGLENIPARGGFVLSANHVSNFDPWPLGVPIGNRHYLRHMAKSELYWRPMKWVVDAGGGFPVKRGERDTKAMETAVELARKGDAVVMFPEGTRRTKGLRKKWEARAHSGAARIALEAGVPLDPGCDRRHRPARAAREAARPLRAADPAGRPEGPRRARGGPARHRPPDGGDPRHGSRARAVTGPLLAVDGDSFAHRAYHGMPKTNRRSGGRAGRRGRRLRD